MNLNRYMDGELGQEVGRPILQSRTKRINWLTAGMSLRRNWIESIGGGGGALNDYSRTAVEVTRLWKSPKFTVMSKLLFCGESRRWIYICRLDNELFLATWDPRLLWLYLILLCKYWYDNGIPFFYVPIRWFNTLGRCLYNEGFNGTTCWYCSDFLC